MPEGAWGRMWAGALALVVIALAALELFWRSLGFAPGPVDDEPITWAELRAEASRAGPRSVALLGTSRSRRGLDPRLVAAELPERRVFQLAIWGANPQPIFANLAADPRFEGTVVYELLPTHLFAPERRAVELAEGYLSLVESPSPAAVSEAHLLRAIRRELVLAREQTELLGALRGFVMHRRLPDPPYLRQREDRGYALPEPSVYGAARVETMRVAAFERAREFVDDWWRHMPEPEPFAVIDARLDAMASQRRSIEARGGRVLFFRMPSCGEVLAREEALYPRAAYYERAVERVGGTWLHFADDPRMASATCMDGSHLDSASGEVVSRALGATLAAMARDAGSGH